MYQDNQDEDKLKNEIEKFRNLLDEEVEGHSRKEYLQKCKEMSENIRKDIQKRIKKGDENQIMKLMKYYSQQNKRLQEMEYQNDEDEESSLLQDQQQVDVQLFEDNTQQRKLRLQNVHKNMAIVKGVYEKIQEVTTQQVEKMFTVEENFSYAEDKTHKASTELIKAQQSQKTKLGYRIVIICILVVIVGLMFLK